MSTRYVWEKYSTSQAQYIKLNTASSDYTSGMANDYTYAWNGRISKSAGSTVYYRIYTVVDNAANMSRGYISLSAPYCDTTAITVGSGNPYGATLMANISGTEAIAVPYGCALVFSIRSDDLYDSLNKASCAYVATGSNCKMAVYELSGTSSSWIKFSDANLFTYQYITEKSTLAGYVSAASSDAYPSDGTQ